jgi:hypothetical protein
LFSVIFRRCSTLIIALVLMAYQSQASAATVVHDYRAQAVSACEGEVDSPSGACYCTTSYCVYNNQHTWLCSFSEDTHEIYGNGCRLRCLADEERDPDGMCQEAICPAGQRGNFVSNSGGGWSWQCFNPEDEPPLNDCGQDDGKTVIQCNCETINGEYNSLADECFWWAEDTDGDGEKECHANEVKGTFNGEEVCVPTDSSDPPPECTGGKEPTLIDGIGWACSTPTTEGEKDNTDTDGDGDPDATDNDDDNDGIPDAEDPDVDGDGTPNASDPDYKGQKVDNSGVENALGDVNNNLGAIDERLQQLATGMGKSNLYLKGIDGNTATTADNSTAMNDYVIQGDDHLNDFGEVAEIGVSMQAISDAINTHNFISSVMNVPTIGSGSCPTFTLPATQFWTSQSVDLCTPIEAQRAFLSSIMVGIWTLLAVIVFLRA